LVAHATPRPSAFVLVGDGVAQDDDFRLEGALHDQFQLEVSCPR